MVKTETIVGVFDTDKGLTSIATPDGRGQTQLVTFDPNTNTILNGAAAVGSGGGSSITVVNDLTTGGPTLAASAESVRLLNTRNTWRPFGIRKLTPGFVNASSDDVPTISVRGSVSTSEISGASLVGNTGTGITFGANGNGSTFNGTALRRTGVPSSQSSIYFTTDCPDIELSIWSAITNANCTVLVNDGLAGTFVLPVAASCMVRLTFATQKERLIQVIGPGGSIHSSLVGVWMNTNYKLWKPELTPNKGRWVFMGDSGMALGGVPYSDIVAPGSMATVAATALGLLDFAVCGIGGCGYLNTSQEKLRVRIPGEVIAPDPGNVFISMGFNDKGYDDTLFNYEINYCYDMIREGLPNANVFVTDIIKTPSTYSKSLLIKDAVQRRDGFYFLSHGDWITGTGNVAAPNGTGNADYVISSDGLHNSAYGHNYVGKRWASFIANVARGEMQQAASPLISAPVNSIAPILEAAVVGGSPVCQNGIWSGSPTPTYTRAFTLNGVAISSSYVFTAGDVGKTLACTVTARNLTGTVTAVSNTVTVASGPATSLTMTGPITGTVGVASSAFTVSADGTLSGSVTVTPSDGGAGGTFTPTTLSLSSGVTSGTFTYTAASSGAKTISITNNGSLTNPGTITYAASATSATALSASGPSSGASGVASSTITVTANGALGSSVTVTPSSTVAGTFSPTSATLANGGSVSFTFTPSATGSATLTFAASGLTSATLVYTVSAASTAPAQVTGLTLGTPTSSTQPLTWTAPSNGGSAITDYLVQYSTDNTNWTTFADGTSTTASATVTGLTASTLYYYRVAAVNAVGTGSYSTSVSGSTTSASAATTTFDATKNWQSQLVYSNGNLTVTNTNTNILNVKGVSVKTAGKFYFEVGNATSIPEKIGICGASTNATTNGTAYYAMDGGLFFDGGNQLNSNFVLGTNTCIAVDLDAKLMWARNGSGNWNNSGTANPATGVGGVSIATLATAGAYIYASIKGVNGAVLNLKAASSSWTYTAPSGFGEWTA